MRSVPAEIARRLERRPLLHIALVTIVSTLAWLGVRAANAPLRRDLEDARRFVEAAGYSNVLMSHHQDSDALGACGLGQVHRDRLGRAYEWRSGDAFGVLCVPKVGAKRLLIGIKT